MRNLLLAVVILIMTITAVSAQDTAQDTLNVEKILRLDVKNEIKSYVITRDMFILKDSVLIKANALKAYNPYVYSREINVDVSNWMPSVYRIRINYVDSLAQKNAIKQIIFTKE